jgi:hypothetical protein
MKMILDLILWNNLVLFEDFTVCTIVVVGRRYMLNEGRYG